MHWAARINAIKSSGDFGKLGSSSSPTHQSIRIPKLSKHCVSQWDLVICQLVIPALLKSKISPGPLKICFHLQKTGTHLLGNTRYIFILISPWHRERLSTCLWWGSRIPFICFIHYPHQGICGCGWQLPRVMFSSYHTRPRRYLEKGESIQTAFPQLSNSLENKVHPVAVMLLK